MIAPHTCIPGDPAAIDPFMAAVTADARARFLDALSDAGLDTLTIAVATACSNGWGQILTPDTRGIRHTTHLFEVTLFDIHATGETMPQAMQNWRTVATRICTPDDAA
jgi:hypothetical protein